MQFVYLAIASVAGVVGASALKASNGFTVWQPSLIVAAGYAVPFYFLSLALRAPELPQKTSSVFPLLHPLKEWSLRESRGGSGVCVKGR